MVQWNNDLACLCGLPDPLAQHRHSGLRFWHCCGISHRCGLDLIPGQMQEKKKKSKSSFKNHRRARRKGGWLSHRRDRLSML